MEPPAILPVVRYQTLVADSARWDEVELRPDDIIITTPPKCGTTWTQMLCGLLIFDGPQFPAPLDQISVWIDMCTRSIHEVQSLIEPQTHRRFLKSHTPLDGLPRRDDVTYLVVGRDPRDVAISFEHHLRNLDFEALMARRAAAVGLDDLASLQPPDPVPEDPDGRMRYFIEQTNTQGFFNLAGVLHHLDVAWRHRHEPNVWFFHYSDYVADLPGELIRLAGVLDIGITETRAEQLAAEAAFDRMRDRAEDLAPEVSFSGWHDTRSFFRAGSSGEWRERMTDDLLELYDARVGALASPELSAWVHQGRITSGVDPRLV
jgi:aryl sulfotransferase